MEYQELIHENQAYTEENIRRMRKFRDRIK